MIIKRNLKSVMPSLKRCRVIRGGEEDDGNGKKKRKGASNGFYPLHLLGEAAAGIIPCGGYSFEEVYSGDEAVKEEEEELGMEVSCCLVEVREMKVKVEVEERKLKGKEGGESSKPALVRTSRGRVQALPSRFSDSVLANWKKDKSKVTVKELDDDPEFNPYKGGKERSKWVKSKLRDDRNGYGGRKASALSDEDEDEDEDDLGWKGSDHRKYSTSRSTLTSSNGRNVDDELSDEEEEEEELDYWDVDGDQQRIYKAKNFAPGDIVWGISGSQSPAWPAVVLDPKTQVPQQVLNFRVASAVCVMFFGYSGNGTQRVSYQSGNGNNYMVKDALFVCNNSMICQQ